MGFGAWCEPQGLVFGSACPRLRFRPETPFSGSPVRSHCHDPFCRGHGSKECVAQPTPNGPTARHNLTAGNARGTGIKPSEAVDRWTSLSHENHPLVGLNSGWVIAGGDLDVKNLLFEAFSKHCERAQRRQAVPGVCRSCSDASGRKPLRLAVAPSSNRDTRPRFAADLPQSGRWHGCWRNDRWNRGRVFLPDQQRTCRRIQQPDSGDQVPGKRLSYL